MASKELTPLDQNVSNVAKWLQSPAFSNQLQRAAPRDVQANRIARVVLTQIRGDKKLMACSVESILSATMVCAQTGLEPGPMGLCAIVPYGNTAQWQIMFKGMLHLAYRSEKIIGVQSEVVYVDDEFDYNEGSNPFVHFKRSFDPDREKRERVAAYCTMTTVGENKPIVRVMGIAEIEEIRNLFDRGNRSDRPWLMHFNEQACKTVIKRTAKRAPMAPECAVAIGYDDLAEVGKRQVVDIGDITPEKPPEDQDKFCNADLGDGIVCGKKPKGHEGGCEG